MVCVFLMDSFEFCSTYVMLHVKTRLIEFMCACVLKRTGPIRGQHDLQTSVNFDF